MQNDPNSPKPSRENILATSLVILGGGMILFYLYIISLGIVGNVLAIAVAFAILGAMHYLLWGRSFSAEVASEREALRRQDAAQPEAPRPKVAADAIQDRARTQGIQK